MGPIRGGFRAALAFLCVPACSAWTPGDEQTPKDDELTSSTRQFISPSFVAAPGGLRRLMGRHYRRSIDNMLGAPAATAAVPPPDPDTGGVDAIAARELPYDPASVQQIEKSAFAVATAAVANLSRLAQHAPCVTQGPFTKQFRDFCYGEVAQRVANLAWRVPPTPTHKARLVQLGQLGEEGAGTDADKFRAGLRILLATILESPSFLYSVEVGVPIAGSQNRKLNGFEVATRMSLFLLGRPPSEALLAQAGAGQLNTAAGVRTAAQAMLSDPLALEAFRDRMTEMFELDRVITSSKPALNSLPGITRESLTASMAEEIQRLTKDVVFDHRRSFLTLLTEETRFIDHNLGALYGVPVTTDWAPVNFAAVAPGQRRAGIMPSAALMTVFSHLTLNSPTRRGLFIRTQMLCQKINSPPPGVNITPTPPQPGLSLRQTFEQEHGGGCFPCHQLMDPLGFPFEAYDNIGRFRTTDNGVDISADAPDEPLGGDFDNGTTTTHFHEGKELMVNILANPAIGFGDPTEGGTSVPRCWINQFYRGAVGIKEAADQESALVDLDVAFAAAGYDLQQLLVELVASRSFTEVGPLR